MVQGDAIDSFRSGSLDVSFEQRNRAVAGRGQAADHRATPTGLRYFDRFCGERVLRRSIMPFAADGTATEPLTMSGAAI